MRKLFTLSIAVLLSVFSINAQYVMKVTLKNGQEKEFDTSEIENIIWPENEDAPETHEWVDLGLPSGTKWATCNVGANSPEEYGSYFAWGEVAEKSVYNWETYAYGSDWDDCQYIGSEISGTQYDVAHVRWGGSWRMPTRTQCEELCKSCTVSWTILNDVRGTKVIGPNGNSIFLPAAGCHSIGGLDGAGSYGDYRLGTLLDYNDSGMYYLRADEYLGCFESYGRYNGASVRPVCP